MGADRDRGVTALTTACDDLQAQLEAGDRSVRHIHEDLIELGAVLACVADHRARLASVMDHMRELRWNIHEQRNALREVRGAAKAVCASVMKTHEKVAALTEKTRALEESGTGAVAPAGDGRPAILEPRPAAVEADRPRHRDSGIDD